MKYFGIIGHAKTAVFSKEIGFLKKHTTFFKLARQLSKLLTFSESSWKIKVRLGLTFFCNFAYDSSYLQTNAFARKQDLQYFQNCKCYKNNETI